MDELLKKDSAKVKQFKQGELVEGIVVSVSHGELLVDVGAKSEGIISGSELAEADKAYKNVNPGDTILAYVLQGENEQGHHNEQKTGKTLVEQLHVYYSFYASGRTIAAFFYRLNSPRGAKRTNVDSGHKKTCCVAQAQAPVF